ncbi:CRISPR-associated endonuclease Cas6 [Spirosoma radiotolerans]|uniref:DNA repair protein n=1 Tax=Spirosoma radiotolerans TaxID=1379870 RepID=A0A0E3ZUE2_9BACT|nr:CRISPR-associated endonuclease Cas6 [Spirosoma radiotolerans]AKD54479.1 DNA repair protein [Spirosoma radiotolerans]
MTTTPPQTLIPITTITFPEIALRTRDAHKLRGYFGELFKAHSPLLHNHLESDAGTDGGVAVKFRYAYPLVQYKVLNHIPTLVGLGEGATLLTQLFLQMREVQIENQTFPVLSKHIRHEQIPIGIADDLIEYRFETLWMALNQDNFRDYRRYAEAEQQAQLKRVLTSQLLALFREFGLWLQPHERILVRLSVEERTTQFKNQTMVAFTGGFLANVILPDGIGLGKAVSRGFGAIQRVKERMSERVAGT